jgi:mono/diheme cytochrome c family protein
MRKAVKLDQCHFLLAAAVMLALSGCGTAPLAPSPAAPTAMQTPTAFALTVAALPSLTATLMPPTLAALPPTATVAPPTATPVPPTVTALPPTLNPTSTVLPTVTSRPPTLSPTRTVSPTAPPTPSASAADKQVADGKDAYAARCQGCHGAKLEGGRGPQLSAKTLGANYPSAEQLVGFVSQAMPLNAPGSLPKAQCYDILAYVLSQLGLLPPGQVLTAETAGRIPIPK